MEETSLKRKVVLTCAQPTGKLHLGNYIGAVRQWVELQESCECFFGIVDMHAITMPYVPADLRKNTYMCAAQYLACGLDPDKCSLFIQSNVIGHAELNWVLACLCPLGQLERMTQFKDKSRKLSAGGDVSIGSGLLFYPVLMAADILIYNADIVPVGEDQKQHLELARDLAVKFNNFYSPTFNVPEAYIPKTGARIMSLQNPEAKMSKSDKNALGSLYMIDSPDVLRKKIMSAVTDSESSVKFSPEKKGISNLISIMGAVSGKSVAEIENEFAGKQYGDFKKAVSDAVIAKFDPIRVKYEELMRDKAYLESVLKRGAEAAQRRADRTMSKVYRKAGFVDAVRGSK
ncbi:MAG: tryptophan--tRNA ligase [Opitutales bacterium]|nr:tryptophan--tRNA ligase [Opitutales bacterium]